MSRRAKTPRTILTPAQDARIRQMRNGGARVTEIMQEMGLGRVAVENALRRLGLPTRLAQRSTRLNHAVVKRGLRAGLTHRQIAGRLREDVEVVRRFVKRNGLDYLSAPEIPLSHLAADLGVARSGLRLLVCEGVFSASRHGRLIVFNREQERAVRAYYAAKPRSVPLGYLSTVDAARLMGVTLAAAHLWLNRNAQDVTRIQTMAAKGRPMTAWHEGELREALKRRRPRRRPGYRAAA